jgi:hypothetical protein
MLMNVNRVQPEQFVFAIFYKKKFTNFGYLFDHSKITNMSVKLSYLLFYSIELDCMLSFTQSAINFPL